VLVVTVGEVGGDALVVPTVDDAGADVLGEPLELHAANATAAVTHSTKRWGLRSLFLSIGFTLPGQLGRAQDRWAT